MADMTNHSGGTRSGNAGISTIRIRPAGHVDLAAARDLLAASSLPTSGLDDQFGSQYAVAVTPAAAMAGLAGLEVYLEYGLLRSVAVSANWRGRGVGRLLVDNRIAAARSLGLTALYALTTTAPEFFAGLGFVVVDRQEVPAPVRRSPEFSSICPDSAVALRFSLR